MSLADDYVAAFEPWLTPDLEAYLRAIGSMFEEVEAYSEDPDQPGWENLLDPDTCPAAALPYLAQYVGERLPVGLAEPAQREWIKDSPNQIRGTVSSIQRAARRQLDPETDRSVLVVERDGGPDRLSIYTYSDQTPNAGAVLRELLTVVPAEITFVYTVLDVTDYRTIVEGIPTYADLPLWFYTYADMWSRVAHGPLAHYEDLPDRYATYAVEVSGVSSYDALRKLHN